MHRNFSTEATVIELKLPNKKCLVQQNLVNSIKRNLRSLLLNNGITLSSSSQLFQAGGVLLSSPFPLLFFNHPISLPARSCAATGGHITCFLSAPIITRRKMAPNSPASEQVAPKSAITMTKWTHDLAMGHWGVLSAASNLGLPFFLHSR